MNKISKIIILSSVFLVLPFNTKKIEANQLEMIPTSIETKAKILPTRVWYSTRINSTAPTYFITTDGRSGGIYRGYLTRVGTISYQGTHTYEGYLYRQDLHYPMPAKLIPQVKNESQGVDTLENISKE